MAVHLDGNGKELQVGVSVLHNSADGSRHWGKITSIFPNGGCQGAWDSDPAKAPPETVGGFTLQVLPIVIDFVPGSLKISES